jgi:peptidoglycan-associated lipoprotein
VKIPCSILALLALGGVIACASAAQPRRPVPITPLRSAEPPPDSASRAENQATVKIEPAIRDACGISMPDAYFAFDSADVGAREQRVLSQLAECFKTGPMSGRTMALVGRADPRGDQEYNLLLGGRRANSVQEVLVAKGLETTRIRASSRGEYDAKGTDERGWRDDRRVDVLLAE